MSDEVAEVAQVDPQKARSGALVRSLVGEAIGTALFVAAIVGSSIAAARLADGGAGLSLLVAALAAGTALASLLLAFGGRTVSFNPLVTIAFVWQGRVPLKHLPAYFVAQDLGAFGGLALAHAMFQAPVFSLSKQVHTGTGQWLSETVATFGLVAVMLGTARLKPRAMPFAAGAFIMAATLFTSSTGFANPSLTFVRAFTDSASGIRLADVPGFMTAQVVGGVIATELFRWMFPAPRDQGLLRRKSATSAKRAPR